MTAIRELLDIQFADDYACSPEEVRSRDNIFTVYQDTPTRRKYAGDGYFQLACLHGKLLATGEERLISWCRKHLQTAGAPWFMEYANLRRLDDRLAEDGYTIGLAHPYFTAEQVTEPLPAAGELQWYDEAEIGQFRGDERFTEAFTFVESAPDVLGIALKQNGRILGMAGASRDSRRMYQIGINIIPEARGRHLGTLLVTRLKNRLLQEGILPYYGTAMSHTASQRIACESGFKPAWSELFAVKRPQGTE